MPHVPRRTECLPRSSGGPSLQVSAVAALRFNWGSLISSSWPWTVAYFHLPGRKLQDNRATRNAQEACEELWSPHEHCDTKVQADDLVLVRKEITVSNAIFSGPFPIIKAAITQSVLKTIWHVGSRHGNLFQCHRRRDDFQSPGDWSVQEKSRKTQRWEMQYWG